MAEGNHTSASIDIGANVDTSSAKAFTGAMSDMGKAAQKAGDDVRQGLTQAASGVDSADKGLTRYRNALINLIAEYESFGDAVAKNRIKAELHGKDISSLVEYEERVRTAKAASDTFAEGQRKIQDEAKKSAKELENLSKQIETAKIKAEQGMSAYSADYYRDIASARGMKLSSRDELNLVAIQNAQAKNAAVAAAMKQINADTQRIAGEERSITGALQRAIDGFATANMTASERFRYQIQQMGLDINKFVPQLKQLELAEQKAAAQVTSAANQMGGALMKNGMTLKQYNAALRGVPAQMTDIFISLQGGQRPLTVLLQQGGQLKDMFGGIGPAFKAVGEYAKDVGQSLLGMVNPGTAVVAVLGTLAAAMYSAYTASQNFENILIRTGGMAGSADGLMRLRDQVAGLTGDTEAATKAVSALASTGKMSFDEIEQSARVAADYMQVTGQSAEEVARKFETLFDNPIEGAKQLNERFNFLTEAIARQYVELVKHGRITEANKLLMDELGVASENAKNRMVTNATGIEAAWHGVKEAILGAWRALVQFYAKSQEMRINEAYDERIAQLGAIGQLSAEELKNEEGKRDAAIAKAKADAASSQKRTDEARKVKKILDQASRAGSGSRGRSGSGRRSRGGAGGGRAGGGVSEYDNLTKSINDQVAALQEEIKYGEKLSAADKLRIRIENESVNAKKKLTEEQKKILLGKVAEMKALENERDAKKFMADYDKKAAKDKAKLINKYEDEIAIIGMGAEQADFYKKKQDILRTAEEQYQEALKKHVDSGVAKRILEEGWERVEMLRVQQEQLRAEYNDPWKALTESMTNYRDEAANTGKQLRDAYKNAFTAMEDSFVKFVTTGKLSFRDLVNSILQDIARMMAKKYVTNFLEGIMSIGGQALAGWLGGGSVAGTQVKDSFSDFSYRGSSVSFTGHRASGGPVSQSKSYLVGENGPELFVPKQSGTIISNDDLQGKNGLGIGGFNIQIQHHNEGTQQQVTDSGADFDGRNLIIKIVTQDIANDGMISRTMGKTFGIRRAAGAM